MNTLSELKELFSKHHLEMRFEGWIIRIGDDRWTMCDGHLYHNGELFNEKKLPEYLKGLVANPPKLRKPTVKKITANRSDEDDGKSIKTH